MPTTIAERTIATTPQLTHTPTSSKPPTPAEAPTSSQTQVSPKPPKRPGIERGDTAREAARKTLRFHFSRMLKHEAGTIVGSDIEELHDMRVAVRRMRAAVQLFRPYLPKKRSASLRKDLRRLGRALGPTRDYDVMLANLETYRAAMPAHIQDGLTPLARRWQKRRARARRTMLRYLTSKRYRTLKRELAAFLEPAGAPPQPGAPEYPQNAAVGPQPLVAAAAPGLVGARYEKLLAYGPSLHGASIETLHDLRIDCKRLRYALEFLREILIPPAAAAIEDVKRAQDHLGDLNDAYVAGTVLRTFLEKRQRDRDDGHYPAAAKEALCGYLAFCDDRARTNAQTFPALWQHLTGDEFRQRLHEIMNTAP